MQYLKTAGMVSGALAGAVLLAGQAFADPVTVDGIQFNSSDNFLVGEVYQNVVSASGGELMGFGRVDEISGNRNYCASGSSCELTFTFSGYMAEDYDNHISFGGGQMMFYADGSANFDASDRSTATDGDLFLSTTGHQYKDITTGRTGTLIETGTNLHTDQAQGGAVGYLDVTGGDAGHYFDTNSFSDFMGGTTDIQFNSTFTPNSCGNATDQPVCGAAFVKSVATGSSPGGPGGSSPSVPEPSALGLMGLGLVGLGFGLRRRRR
jgi:hypothetical protein